MNKFYRIADITIQLNIPMYFEEEERYEQFAIEKKEAENIDFCINFVSVTEPVDQMELIMDFGETRYYRKQDILIEEYCSGGEKTPFRWLYVPKDEIYCDSIDSGPLPKKLLSENTRIWTCYYLQKYEKNFGYISQIFKHISLNRMINLMHGVMFHCSFIKTSNVGILFSGPSGIGKSTQAELWKREKQADVLNGDRAIIRKKDDKWYAYGLPYAGSSNIFRNESAPIAAIVVLKQAVHKEMQKDMTVHKKIDDFNRIIRLRPVEACKAVLSEVFQSRWDRDMLLHTLGMVESLISEVPVYQLACTPDKAAVECLNRKLQEDSLI